MDQRIAALLIIAVLLLGFGYMVIDNHRARTENPEEYAQMLEEREEKRNRRYTPPVEEFCYDGVIYLKFGRGQYGHFGSAKFLPNGQVVTCEDPQTSAPYSARQQSSDEYQDTFNRSVNDESYY